MSMKQFEYRFAEIKDVGLILAFIKALAEYEQMADVVIANEESLKEWLFEKKVAQVIFAIKDNQEVGFALYFYNFSTFLGKAGIYLEDLFVFPEFRGQGYGKGLLKQLAKIALERNLGRIEWVCLNWNKPSIDFYLSIGAKPLSDWATYRLSDKELENLANKE